MIWLLFEALLTFITDYDPEDLEQAHTKSKDAASDDEGKATEHYVKVG